ncbi:winged helix-turn-helix transcriptional regulator [archaeon]|nr:winged helix-turn-helix transcriptional regulator [archaeon]
MKAKLMKLLMELLKDSKRSDREISKVLGVSQPTISRMRQRLTEEGIIQEFTVIPDFVKMGFQIMAISSFKYKVANDIDGLRKLMMAKPNVIFASLGDGIGKNGIIISFHRSYPEFSSFISTLRAEGNDIIDDIDSMLIILENQIVKPLSLKYLTELEEK